MPLIPENEQIRVKFNFLTPRAKSLILQYSISNGFYLSAKSVKNGVHHLSAHIRLQTNLRRETLYQVYTLYEKVTMATVLLHQKKDKNHPTVLTTQVQIFLYSAILIAAV